MVIRTFRSLLSAAVLLLPLGAAAQVINVGGELPGIDPRPVGKYLVEVCTVHFANLFPRHPGTLECATFNPSVAPHKRQIDVPPQPTAQKLTLKQVGCMSGASPCPDPKYPLVLGSTFYIEADSDSGLPVDLLPPLSGQVTQVAVSGTPDRSVRQFTVTGPGTIVFQATQGGDPHYAPAAPVQLILAVTASPEGGDRGSCKGLLPSPSAATAQPQLDVATLAGLVGNPVPFVISAAGTNTILIYSTREPLRDSERQTLRRLPGYLAQLAGRTVDELGSAAAKSFKVEVRIPHAPALGDLASRISALNYSQFTVQDIGAGSVRITAAAQPDCTTWTAFLNAIRQLEWSVSPQPFTTKLYYLSAADAVTALNSVNSAAAGGSGGASPTGGSAAPAAGAGTPAAGGGTPAGGGTAPPFRSTSRRGALLASAPIPLLANRPAPADVAQRLPARRRAEARPLRLPPHLRAAPQRPSRRRCPPSESRLIAASNPSRT